MIGWKDFVWIAVVAMTGCFSPVGVVSPDAVADYISHNLPLTVRTGSSDETHLDVPKPFTVPCADDVFQDLFYWDTYFANLALLRMDMVEQARNNAEDIASLIDRYGFMPNASRKKFLSRSQPPFFTRMVSEVYERTGDRAWLARMYASACREHRFWQEKRMSPSGLNRYAGTFDDDESQRRWGRKFCRRIGVPEPSDDATLLRYGACFMSYAESGWDCTSRFRYNAQDANWTCHNALLYGMECDLARFAEILGKPGDAAAWRTAATKRKDLMNELMWDEAAGMFCDYDYVRRQKSGMVSAAAFYPLFTGLATPQQAARTRALLKKLEFGFGVVGCENRNLQNLQWDYPHVWAPIQYIVIEGLRRYGYAEDARRIAGKFRRTVEKTFADTGLLWEKYDVRTGGVSVSKEYATPRMLGWTAGVYVACGDGEDLTNVGLKSESHEKERKTQHE